MKQLLALTLLTVSFMYFSMHVDLLDQIVALLLVGLVPFTDYVVPAFMMFFIWVFLPAGLIASFFAAKGAFLLTLLAIEAVEYKIKELYDSRKNAKKTKKSSQKFSLRIKNNIPSLYLRVLIVLRSGLNKFTRRDTSA